MGLMKKKERQDKAEMKRKKLMIKEIRMLEAELIENKNNNKVQLDLTTTAGHELLGEMSMMELRERLSLVKEKHKIEEEEKRNEILENKKKFEVRLQMAQEKVQIHRSQKVNLFTFTKFLSFSLLDGGQEPESSSTSS